MTWRATWQVNDRSTTVNHRRTTGQLLTMATVNGSNDGKQRRSTMGTTVDHRRTTPIPSPEEWSGRVNDESGRHVPMVEFRIAKVDLSVFWGVKIFWTVVSSEEEGEQDHLVTFEVEEVLENLRKDGASLSLDDEEEEVVTEGEDNGLRVCLEDVNAKASQKHGKWHGTILFVFDFLHSINKHQSDVELSFDG
nr:hypothetical protein [Tanacetum cinerariifolium]